MTTISKFHSWRRIVAILQAATLLGLPFIKINGKSALRFDIPSLELHFFGSSLWMEDFFIVLIATIFLSFLIILITVLLGRIWCGWVCPQTVIADFTAFIEKTAGRGLLNKILSWSVLFLISIVIAANLIWYFVSPYEFFPSLLSWQMGNVVWWFWIVLTLIIFLNFAFLRQTFCATVCPYAKLQSTLYDDKTLVIAFDPRRKEECIECMACVKTCPVGIDIRKGLSDACINCAECIDACTLQMERKGKRTLIDYFFGLPGETGRLFRQNAVLLGTVTIAFLVFFIYLLLSFSAVDVTVLPNNSFSPRTSKDGGAVNSYILSVKNKGKSDVELKVEISNMEGRIRIVPQRLFHVSAGEMKKFPVYITIDDMKRKELTEDPVINIELTDDSGINIVKKARFIVPEN